MRTTASAMGGSGTLCTARRRFNLLLEHLFNLADFLLDLAGELFVLAFGLQLGVVRDLSRFLFGFAFHFMDVSFDLILCARFHIYSPLFFPARFVNHFLPLQSGTRSEERRVGKECRSR